LGDLESSIIAIDLNPADCMVKAGIFHKVGSSLKDTEVRGEDKDVIQGGLLFPCFGSPCYIPMARSVGGPHFGYHFLQEGIPLLMNGSISIIDTLLGL
jgi:hypothetical protein